MSPFNNTYIVHQDFTICSMFSALLPAMPYRSWKFGITFLVRPLATAREGGFCFAAVSVLFF